ncbi:hypothetical protein RJ639_036322 [Escallonia herrerae]|uniref:CCHC-type domain-containing protein n=1 Tax=Escallonia herrerae TaxID=1293975 RepID=A0AA88WW18_9ASTE|nr:hypothetical protein RJ639_036322 [Escallonia herrerae]
MAEEGKGKIEKFNGMNFQWWKMQVEDYLYQKDLYLSLVGEKPEAMNASEWAILDRKALATNNKQNNRGRSPIRGRSRSRGKSKSKGKTIVCWNCNKEGHKKNDCTEPKKKNGAGARQSDDEGANKWISQKRVSFWRDGKEKKIERLELVHTDVCGPTTVKSLGDDASRKTWIYAIRQKSDVYHTFKKWKVLVENEIGNKVKCLKSDNGGEYRDGVSIVMEGSKNIVPVTFWAAAVDTAVYLINRSPASALNGGIPEEEWSGKPVKYSFMRVFGCIAYAHIDKEERKKLDSKSQKYVFIGYGGDEYGYRLWNYEHNKIIRSRDVIFDESRLYKHRLQEHGIEKENREYMELDELEDGQVPRTENSEVLDETTDTEIGAGDQQQVPETLNLRRSSQSLLEDDN